MLFKYYLPLGFSALSLLLSGYIFMFDKNKGLTPVFLSVDFEQGFYDARLTKVEVNPGDWMSSVVESMCSSSPCVVFQGGTILGGNVTDVNQMFREAFNIERPADKPNVNSQDFLNFIKLLEDRSKQSVSKE